MNYELKHYDLSLVRFSATEDTNTPEIKILWVNAPSGTVPKYSPARKRSPILAVGVNSHFFSVSRPSA